MNGKHSGNHFVTERFLTHNGSWLRLNGHLSLNNDCELFHPLPLMPQFFVASCVAIASKERKFGRFPGEMMQNIFGPSVLRRFPHRRRDVTFRTLTGNIDSKV